MLLNASYDNNRKNNSRSMMESVLVNKDRPANISYSNILNRSKIDKPTGLEKSGKGLDWKEGGEEREGKKAKESRFDVLNMMNMLDGVYRKDVEVNSMSTINHEEEYYKKHAFEVQHNRCVSHKTYSVESLIQKYLSDRYEGNYKHPVLISQVGMMSHTDIVFVSFNNVVIVGRVFTMNNMRDEMQYRSKNRETGALGRYTSIESDDRIVSVCMGRCTVGMKVSSGVGSCHW